MPKTNVQSPEDLAKLAKKLLDVQPFPWQLEAAAAILRGEDVIVDVGTGSGKTLCFTLPLLTNSSDIAMIISPLTALMMEHAESTKLGAVAICRETLEPGRDELLENVAAGLYQQVYISPEIAESEEFSKTVLRSPGFYKRLRTVIVDEAHCISDWGGSFRPDYSNLGILRDRIPRKVPVMVASATFPDHVLLDVRSGLRIRQECTLVQITNDRPNVALSVRVMEHPEESKADLRCAISMNATKPEDIPVTIIYMNVRHECERTVDKLRSWLPPGIPADCIAFYHAKIGTARKREIEKLLQEGKIRILVCTEAMGMGCDLRNIRVVYLWDLPPTFCALAQRAGRAARDMTVEGEAILIVRKSVLKQGITGEDVSNALDEAVREVEAQNTVDGGEDMSEGVEQLTETSGEGEVTASPPNRSRGAKRPTSKVKSAREVHEATFLTRFARTSGCLREVWADYFGNQKKAKLEYGKNTLYRPIPNARCCYNCQPDRFPIPKVLLGKGLTFTLKSGRRRRFDHRMEQYIRVEMKEWRRTELMDLLGYSRSSLFMTGAILMTDDIVEQVATSGKQLESANDLQDHIRWRLAYDVDGSDRRLSKIGDALLHKLRDVYAKYKLELEAAYTSQANAQGTVPAESLHAPSPLARNGTAGKQTGRSKKK